MNASVVGFVATIGSTCEPVTTVDGRACLTPQRGVTNLCAVAEEPVTAGSIVGSVDASIAGFVARIRCTGDCVIAIRRRPRLAAQGGVTGFGPVAKLPVAANGIVRRMCAGVV